MLASQMALVVKNLPDNAGDTGDSGLIPWVRKMPWRRDRPPTPVFLGFPRASDGRVCLQCGGLGFDPWVEKIPWRREQLHISIFWP